MRMFKTELKKTYDEISEIKIFDPDHYDSRSNESPKTLSLIQDYISHLTLIWNFQDIGILHSFHSKKSYLRVNIRSLFRWPKLFPEWQHSGIFHFRSKK